MPATMHHIRRMHDIVLYPYHVSSAQHHPHPHAHAHHSRRATLAAPIMPNLCHCTLCTLPQADWAAPRPLWEFCTKFSIPKNHTKWTSRLKCNAYYYRSNYLALLLLSASVALLRQPLALAGALLLVLGAMLLNEPFSTAFKCAG